MRGARCGTSRSTVAATSPTSLALATVAAGIVVQKLGAATATPDEVRAALVPAGEP